MLGEPEPLLSDEARRPRWQWLTLIGYLLLANERLHAESIVPGPSFGGAQAMLQGNISAPTA